MSVLIWVQTVYIRLSQKLQLRHEKSYRSLLTILTTSLQPSSCTNNFFKWIFFSNGDLDPWSSGGVPVSPSLSIIPILIRDGAHHLDLRASNPQDTPEVKDARIQEKNIMKMWLGQS